MATVAGQSLFLTANHGDSNNREENRDAKN